MCSTAVPISSHRIWKLCPTMSSLPNPHCGDRAIELQQFTARPMSTPQLSSSLQFDIYNLRSILYNFEFPIYNLPFVIHNLELPIYYSPPYQDMIRLNKKITVYNFEFTIYNFAPLCQSLSPSSFVHQLHPAEFTNT